MSLNQILRDLEEEQLKVRAKMQALTAVTVVALGMLTNKKIEGEGGTESRIIEGNEEEIGAVCEGLGFFILGLNTKRLYADHNREQINLCN